MTIKKPTNITSLNKAGVKSNFVVEAKETKKVKIRDKFSPKLLISLVLFLLFFAIAYFGGYNQYLSITKSQKLISEKNNQLEKLSAQRSYLNKLTGDRGELEEKKKLAIQAVPTTSKISNLMNQIIKIADVSGDLKLESLSFSGLTNGDENENKNKFNKIVLQTTASGSFFDIVDFVKNLEQSRRVLVIDSVSYNRSPPVGSNESDSVGSGYTISLNISGYYMPEVDVNALDIEQLTKSPKLDDVVIKLRSYKYYAVDDVLINVGDNADPFDSNSRSENPNNLNLEETQLDSKPSDNNDLGGGISPVQ